jgi:hypothetical protein
MTVDIWIRDYNPPRYSILVHCDILLDHQNHYTVKQ